MSKNVPDYMSSLIKNNEIYETEQERLVKVLLLIPEFQNKNTIIPFYSAYEFPEIQNNMVFFWHNALIHVLINYFQRIIFTKQEMKSVFTFDKFKPLCLDDMIVNYFTIIR